MRVLVIGANGQIGRHVVEKLETTETMQPVAALRKEEQIQDFSQKGYQTVFFDLENSIDELAEAMEGIEAVVFTAGSGGDTGADLTMMIDLDGAIKTMEAAKKVGIKRYVIVSAINSDDRNQWSGEGAGGYYYAAKFYADEWLKNSGLDYTIIRPGLLTNDEGTGRISIADDLEPAEIPRADVAATIVAVLPREEMAGQAFDLVGGDMEIEAALQS